MKYCILCMLIFCNYFAAISFAAISQTNLTIEYGEISQVISFKKERDVKEYNRKHYVYTNGDSLGFCSFQMQKPDKKTNTVGSGKDHHAVFTFPKLNRTLAENYWVKPYHLQEYELKKHIWQINVDTIWVAGYKCKAASADGVVAWFAIDIPVSFGPAFYSGLPGLILMVEDYRNRRLYKATSVKTDSPKIVMPDLKIKGCKDCESKLPEIEKYFEH